MSPLKTGFVSYSCGVLRVMSDLEDDPLFLIVGAPHTTLVLETGSSCLSRGVHSPCIGWKEFLDSSSLDEGGDRLFNHGSCGKRPYRGSLSLERDRRGGIVGRFAGHEASKALEYRSS